MHNKGGFIEIGGSYLYFPVIYDHTTVIGASFPASMDRISNLMPSPKLRPILYAGDKASVFLLAMQYRVINGLDPYNEFAVMIPVTFDSEKGESGPPAYYAVYTPVTTYPALELGVKGYGYPKFPATISFLDTDESCRCQVQIDDSNIITLEVEKVEVSEKNPTYIIIQ